MSLEIITATEKAIANIPQAKNKISSIGFVFYYVPCFLFLPTPVTGNLVNFLDHVG